MRMRGLDARGRARASFEVVAEVDSWLFWRREAGASTSPDLEALGDGRLVLNQAGESTNDRVRKGTGAVSERKPSRDRIRGSAPRGGRGRADDGRHLGLPT